MSWDLRKNMPYGGYDQYEFDVPVGRNGDAFDRYWVRILEMKESARIVRQALEKLPEGEFMAKVPRKIKPEAGEALSRVESARGEMAYYVVSDGSERPYRLRARTGSFMAMGIIEDVSPGLMVADLVATMANKKGLRVDVFPGDRGAFEVGTEDVGTLVAVMLRRQREKHGLSLSEVARRLGSRSKTSYARYEQGRSVPTVEKLFELLAAVAPGEDFVFHESPRRHPMAA